MIHPRPSEPVPAGMRPRPWDRPSVPLDRRRPGRHADVLVVRLVVGLASPPPRSVATCGGTLAGTAPAVNAGRSRPCFRVSGPHGFRPGIFGISFVMAPSFSFISAIRALLRAIPLLISAIWARVAFMLSFDSSILWLDRVTL